MDPRFQEPEPQRRHHKPAFPMPAAVSTLPQQHLFYSPALPHPQPDYRMPGAAFDFVNMPPRQYLPLTNSNPPQDMSHRRLPMPVLHNQQSPPVIDLTEDTEPPSSQNRRSSPRRAAPPHLERSDSIQLGAEVIHIDSSDDESDNNDNEVEFVSEQPARNPLPRLGHPVGFGGRQSQIGHHPRYNPQEHRQHYRNININVSPRAPRPDHRQRAHAFDPNPALWQADFNLAQQQHLYAVLGAPPRMPGQNLDYHHNAFDARAAPDQRRQEYVPPPPARGGFTRNPKEEDVVVCPACDEELVVGADEKESHSDKKPSAKKKSKADRAEHPFWVVKECGHVYCNKCFQNRKPPPHTAAALFPEKKNLNSKPKKYECAVHDCQSEVTDKKHWVGVFL